MNRMIKASVVVALLGAVAAPVLAQIPPSSSTMPLTTNATTGSGVIVEVFDAATGLSMTTWLGNTFSSMSPSNATASIDFGDLAGWASFVAAETTATGGANNLQFAVFAGQAISGTPGIHIIESTVAAGVTPNNTAVTTGLGQIGQAIAADMQGTAGCNGTNPCTALTSSSPGYSVNTLGPNFGGKWGGTTVSAGLAANLDFYSFTVNTGAGISPSTKTTYAMNGLQDYWTVNATTGDVQFVVPGAVPLPAGAWLLGSGLLGLLGIGRRRVLAA